MARYNISTSERQQSTSFQTSRLGDANRSQSVALEETHIFSPNWLSQARLGFTRSRVFAGITSAVNANANDPSLTFLPGAQGIGKITVGGLTDFSGGTNGLDADRNVQNTWQFGEDLSLQSGRHSLRFGAYLQRIQFNTNSQNYQSGFFQFSDLAALLANRPLVLRAQVIGSDTIRAWRQWLFAGYVQDAWRVSDRFAVDLGVRYEAITVPTEANGKIANLDTLLSPAMRVGDPAFRNPSLKNFGPRTGFSWDVFGDGSTVVRGGYGIYFDQLMVHFLLLFGLRNPPFFEASQTFSLAQGDFPKKAYQQLIDPPPGSLRVDRIPPDLSQPYVQHWNLHVIRKLERDTTLRAGYIGSHGVHMSRIVNDANLAPSTILPDGRVYFPANGKRQNPNFGQIRDHPFDGHSFYDALQMAVERRWRRGFQAQGSYTWGKSIDDDSMSFLPTESTNSIGVPIPGSPHFNRGLSNHDVRHLFTGSFLWDIPELPGRRAHALFGGWSVGAMVVLQSGLPFSVVLGYDAARSLTSFADYRAGQRPDLTPGTSRNLVTGDPNHWFDTSAFLRPQPGFLGNLGRNTLEGPGLANVDFNAVKEVPLSRFGERTRLQIHAAAFNLVNHPNFDQPDQSRATLFTSSGTVEDAGRITHAQPSREIQLGVRITF
jgi:hypothetical protein